MTKTLTLKATAIRDSRGLSPQQKLALHLKEHPELEQVAYGSQSSVPQQEIQHLKVKKISIDILLAKVLEAYDLTLEQISKETPRGHKRSPRIRDAQYAFCHLAWTMTLESQRAIGRKIKREQSHVASICFRAKENFNREPEFRKKVEEIRKQAEEEASE
jgi:chromosomal replication initiation ATPase DnaA